jgi:AbrB family looped-hinge helix DNA binding protein
MDIDACFYGAATVGERGQIVIPADARTALGIKPGDKLLVFRDPVVDGITLAPLEAVQSVLEHFSRLLEHAGGQAEQ